MRDIALAWTFAALFSGLWAWAMWWWGRFQNRTSSRRYSSTSERDSQRNGGSAPSPRVPGGGRSSHMTPGTLLIVSTPIGNLADLSSRALETLQGVSVVYAEDTRHSSTLLRHYGFKTALRSLHEHNEARRIDEVLERLAGGEDCALISDAGTPTVSDPGTRLVTAVADAGFRVVPIPGPSAVTAALAASGSNRRRAVASRVWTLRPAQRP